MFFADFNKSISIGAAIIALGISLTLFGCNSSKAPDAKVPSKQSTAVAQKSTDPDIDLNCVINHLQNPPESFHYMFKDESDNPWAEEADVTPQMIDGSFKNNSVPAPVPLHAAPQEMPHQYQWAIGRMASLFALVRGTSAVVNEGAEKGVNGYDTVKYSIDTTRANATEQALYTSTLGPGGSERGTVWVTAEGCPVRIALDEELHSKDGSVSGKAHYEEAMVKK
jgi:hypothetical protein